MTPATGFILWFLQVTGAWAVTTPWRVVYCRPEHILNPRLLKHEQVHLEQICRDGALKWTVKIFYYLIRYGYHNSPYEVEARKIAGI